MRAIVAVFVILGVLLGAWFVLDGPADRADALREPERRTDPAEEKDAAEGKGTARKDNVETTRQPVGQSLPEARYETIPEEQAIGVAVCRGDTGVPVPDATVGYVGMAALQKIPREQRDAVRDAGWARIVEEFGFRAKLDDRGLATVRADARAVLVHARSGDLSGVLFVESSAPEPAGGWKLLLRPTAGIRLRVVGEKGQALEGIPIALQYRVGAAGEERPITRPVGKTSAKGVYATELGILLQSLDGEGSVTGTRLVVNLPGLTDVGLDLRPEDPPRGDVELRLPTTGRIRCEFVDPSGKTAIGPSSVRLRAEGLDGWFSGWARANQPVPSFETVGLNRRYHLSATLGQETRQLTLDGPTRSGQEVVARFTFPAVGRVVVKITYGAGIPFVSIRNYVDLRLENNRGMQTRFDDKGVARFDGVPLGQKLTAQVSRPSITKQFIGPSHAGEEVAVNLRISDSVPILTARIVDAKGEPMPGKKMRLKLEYRNGGGERIVVCDATGRFVVPLQRGGGENILHAVLRAADERGEMIRGSARVRIPKPLGGGVTDLGDVVFRTRPVLLAGRFVGYKPDRSARPSLYVERHRVYEVRGKRRERWRRDETMHLIRIGDDRFEYRGEAEPARRRLTVSVPGYLPVEPIEFALGTKDLEIQLTRGGSLSVGVAVEEGVDSEMLRARMVPRRGGKGVAPRRDFRGGRNAQGRVRYRWAGLVPGFYRLELALIGGTQPLMAVDGVEVVGGEEVRDARLDDLDLRGKIRPITIRIVDPSGKPFTVRRDSLVLVKPRGSFTEVEGRSFRHRDRVKIAIGTAPVDLLVIVDGHPVKELRGVERDTTVRLDAPRQVRIKLRGEMPTLPEGATLRLVLVGKSEKKYARVRYRTDSSGGGFGSLFDSRSESVTLKGSEVVCTVPGTGEHKVYCLLRRANGRLRNVAVEPASVEVRDVAKEQAFEIAISQAAVDAAGK